MHAKKNLHSIPSYLKVTVSLTITALLVIAGVAVYFSGHDSKFQPANAVVQFVPQPPTAAQIASEEGCTGFTDLFKAGGDPSVLDEGSCYVSSVKYAIDTFASQSARDAWVKIAEPYGVVPKWETATSVTYKSVGK